MYFVTFIKQGKTYQRGVDLDELAIIDKNYNLVSVEVIAWQAK